MGKIVADALQDDLAILMRSSIGGWSKKKNLIMG